jgi:hypothetical protein
MNYIIEDSGTFLSMKRERNRGEPDEKHPYRKKGDKPFKMICGVPKKFE